MELEGRKELVDTGKSSGTWSVPTVSLRLAVLNVFQGIFGPKMAVFGPKLQFLKVSSATYVSRSQPPPLIFLLKLCVIVLHTHRYHPPKFHANRKHHNGVLIFTHFRACCLLACLLLAACLLAAKPGRSTLDTKKGYKTKTGSTSSVTLTLTSSRDPGPLRTKRLRSNSAHLWAGEKARAMQSLWVLSPLQGEPQERKGDVALPPVSGPPTR